MKPFSKWTIAEVEDIFQVVLRKQNDTLKEWLNIRSALSEESSKKLDELRETLLDHVHDWNEAELKYKFIIHLLSMIDFDQEKYQSFMERELSVSINGETLSGKLDFMVAGGRRIPRHPYFFLHEYKRELDTSNDPLGQIMAAMIAAQKLNNDGYPLYGVYVTGRLWFFVILDGFDYSVSLAYDATKDDIKNIFSILQNTKQIIEKRFKGDCDKIRPAAVRETNLGGNR